MIFVISLQFTVIFFQHACHVYIFDKSFLPVQRFIDIPEKSESKSFRGWPPICCISDKERPSSVSIDVSKYLLGDFCGFLENKDVNRCPRHSSASCYV